MLRSNDGARRRSPLLIALTASALVAAGSWLSLHPRWTSDATSLRHGELRLEREDHAPPVAFIPNRGQFPRQVRFSAVGTRGTLFVTDEELRFVPNPRKSGTLIGDDQATDSVDLNGSVMLKFVGIPRMDRDTRLPGTVSYLRGGDPARWVGGIPTYAGLRFQDPHSGAVTHLDGRTGRIQLSSPVAGRGSLERLSTGIQPRVRAAEEDRAVLGLADPTGGVPTTLLDDPELLFATYLGGSQRFGDLANDVAVDGSGAIYVTGETYSADFPTDGPLQLHAGDSDVFVTKLRQDGSTIEYSTFIGGAGTDAGRAIAVDPDGRAVLTGDTDSPDFPTLNAHQSARAGDDDAFLGALTPSGDALRSSTYLGGRNDETGHGVTLVKNLALVVGETASPDFPVSTTLQPEYGGGSSDAFVTQWDPSTGELGRSSFFGGAGADSAAAVTVGDNGSVYVAGTTGSNSFPGTDGGPLHTHRGEQDAFVAQLGSDASPLQSVALFGGSGRDVALDLALDGDGLVVVVGHTTSGDLPLMAAIQPQLAGAQDGFVARLDLVARSIDAATYFGGDDEDMLTSAAVDSTRSVLIAGRSASAGWIDGARSVGPLGDFDAIVARISDGPPDVDWLTRVGGTDADGAQAVTVDAADNVTVVGYTTSDDWPAEPDAVQPEYGGGNFDGFVLKLGDPDAVLPTSTPGPGDDGRTRLVFARVSGGGQAGASVAQGGGEHYDLFLAGRTGAGASRLFGGPDDAWQPEWSPDCSLVLFPRGRREIEATATPTRVIDPTVPPTGVTPENTPTATATFRPQDAKSAASITGVQQIGDAFDLWTIRVDGTGATRLTNTPWNEVDPAYSPDGSRIAYATDRNNQWDIWVADADGGNAQRLTTNPLEDVQPAWSPDGTRIAYSCNIARQFEICVIDAVGGEPQILMDRPSVHDGEPAWIPDGRYLAFVSESFAQRRGDIWIVRQDGSDAQVLAFGPGDERDPAWAPDGALLFSADGQPRIASGSSPTESAVLEAHQQVGQGGRAIWEVSDFLSSTAAIWRVPGRQPALCRERATPTAEASVAPSTTPTGTPTPTGAPPRITPTGTPTLDTGDSGIVGQLMAESTREIPTMKPIVLLPEGSALSVVTLDGLDSFPIQSGAVDSAGRFQFTDLPQLTPPSSHAVRFSRSRPVQDLDLLMRWQSQAIDLAPGERRDLGIISLSASQLEITPGVPQEGMPVDLRFVPAGSIESEKLVVLRDPDTGEPVYASEPISRTESYVFDALPRMLTVGKEYTWEIVHADRLGAVGLPETRGRVVLEEGQLMPRPTLKPIIILPTGDEARPDDGARVAQAAQPPPLVGLPLAMNQHTPGMLIETLRQSGAVVGGVYGGRPPPLAGAGVTGIQIQNVATGGGDADITAAFFEQYDPYDPGQLYSQQPADAYVHRRSAAPGAAANIYLPTSGLPTAATFSGLFHAGETPLAAIFRADWPATGGAAIYSNVQGSDELVVPLVVRDFAGQNSVVTIQNLSPPLSDARLLANVRLQIYAAGSTEIAAERHIALRKGQSVTVDLGSIHPAFTRLGQDFVGSMRIVADSLIGVQALVGAGDSSVSGFEGVPSDAAAETLFVPLFRAGQAGPRPGDRLDTGISVVNPGDEPVDVTVDFRPTNSSNPAFAVCQAVPRYLERATITAGSSHVFYQGAGGRAGMTPPMPEPCYGSAIIRATGGVMAIVQDGQNGTELLSAYNAVPDRQTARRVAVPLFRNDHSVYRLTTGIQVMNAGDEVAHGVRIAFRSTNPDGSSTQIPCGPACSADIPVGGSHTFYPGNPAMDFPRGIFGAAVIDSPVPLAVIVNDYPLAAGVDAAIYNAIPVE